LLGQPYLRPTKAEQEMRLVARRSVVALRNIARGEALEQTNIGLRRPGGGLPPDMIARVLGLLATRDIKRGERLTLGDMQT
jgi:N,N'-diacetyllegionaminate synthase